MGRKIIPNGNIDLGNKEHHKWLHMVKIFLVIQISLTVGWTLKMWSMYRYIQNKIMKIIVHGLAEEEWKYTTVKFLHISWNGIILQ